ncbi:MAG: hypothetical protein Q9217_006671 [Psora testacea]
MFVLTQDSIVLVHGLRGHPFETWASSQQADDERAVGPSSRRQHIRSFFKSSTSPSESYSTQKGTSSQQQQVFWPKDYLTKDIPQARVWTYGYNADVISGLFQANNKNSVSGHGRDLQVRLEREIDEKALRRSEACCRQTRFIAFLGTPHRGSTWAGWGEIASNLVRQALQDPHKKIVEALNVDSEVLDNIHEQFRDIVFQHGIQIHSFQEARGISGVKGLHEKVVDDFSSKLDLPFLETVESIDANHMQMARCKDPSDESYRFITGVLKQFLKRGSLSYPISSKPAIYRSSEEAGRIGRKVDRQHDCQKLALVGLSGVGKTQVALELAYTVKERWPEYSIFWVPALSAESFEQAYRDIATRYSIILNPKEEDLKESVRRYLNNISTGKWLLVVDNSDDQEVLFGTSAELGGVTDYLPESENGLTLFTTRHREVAVSLAGSDVVEIQEMDCEEAETFLTKSLTRKEWLRDRTVVTELLNELTNLPLAIAQAAAYLNAMQISIQDYLALLKNTEQDTVSLLSREFRDETRYKKSQNSIATTWLVSFDQIRRSDPIAADLLSFISCIENKAIPRSILPFVEPEERMVHAIGTLHAYAFLIRRDNGNTYDIHRLVHLATKVWLVRHGTTREVDEKVATHLATVFPSNDYRNRALWREYFPHALRFLKDTRALDNKSRYDLCMAVGKCLQVDGRIGEAVAWLSECCLRWQKHFPEDDPDRLASQHELARAYRADGQIRKAIELFEQIVAIKEKLFTEDHPYRLVSQHGLAVAYQADGQVKKAIELLKQIVTTEEKVLAEDHPFRLASQYELARAYLADGQIK